MHCIGHSQTLGAYEGMPPGNVLKIDTKRLEFCGILVNENSTFFKQQIQAQDQLHR